MTLLRYIRKVVVVVIVVVKSQINLIPSPKRFGMLNEIAFLYVWFKHY